MSLEQSTSENGWCVFGGPEGKIYEIEGATKTTIRFGGEDYPQFYDEATGTVIHTVDIVPTGYPNKWVYMLRTKTDAEDMVSYMEAYEAEEAQRLKLLDEVTERLKSYNVNNLWRILVYMKTGGFKPSAF